jgi:hypothetical protein
MSTHLAPSFRALLAGCVESRSVLSYREEAFAR